jgi:hypothetical protein
MDSCSCRSLSISCWTLANSSSSVVASSSSTSLSQSWTWTWSSSASAGSVVVLAGPCRGGGCMGWLVELRFGGISKGWVFCLFDDGGEGLG